MLPTQQVTVNALHLKLETSFFKRHWQL